MKNILDMLFVKNKNLDIKAFRNLFYSSDKSSFAGFEIDKLRENKLYDNYEILKELKIEIGEKHKEFKAFIKLKDNKYFIRILKDNDDKAYDILIYLINNDNDYNKYDRIFFPKGITIPDALNKINKCIIYVDNNVNIVKNEGMFSSHLGYEDWDYKNKCLNKIDSSCIENILNDFKNNDFIGVYSFKTNSSNIIKLKISFKYYDGFYYIDDIEKI